jgi:Fic family protein
MSYENVVRWWQDRDIKTGDDLEVALNNFSIVFATNSNCIEGNKLNYHTTREIFEGKPLVNFTGDLRDIFEAQNQKLAANFIIESFNSKQEIDIDFILKLHSILLYGCYDSIRWSKGERPGTFKVNDYEVGISGVGSFPDEVEEDLKEILYELDNNKESADILMKATYLHANFESIHPFADGNGRVGRTLLNYYLLLNNYPPLIIFSEDKDTYYLALEVFDRTGELKNFKLFLQEQTCKTWKLKKDKSKEMSINKYLDCF